jgi:hypothetical protein
MLTKIKIKETNPEKLKECQHNAYLKHNEKLNTDLVNL